MYLMWYEPNRKATVNERVLDAIDAYRIKYGREPKEVVLNPECAEQAGEVPVSVVTRPEVARSMVYVGDND